MTSRGNESFDELPLVQSGIAINTFGEHEKQGSITNLTFRPQSTTGASEVFERPDSMTLDSSSVVPSSSRKSQLRQQMLQRRLFTVVPDEVDRSVGSSTFLETDTLRDDNDSYVVDAEIRLNLFMNDVSKDGTTV
ncbi:hypothetical protein KIN20_000069 [Parelaphostrongylus tenuis]|uniref:Uncharacterized protein n=1 Tax=Parelaphostrongylus tenuis TaxID=148309 RepID=A0AAD5LU80_PARTN|nr:hypothetical protein KIN20_000069 [Parelaphostrongylus tenuis]